MSQTPTACTIRDGTFDLTLAIVDISSLHVHEETIPALARYLADLIAADGYVKDPIVVDKKTLTVLDGVHRVAALRKLGIPRIPACLVDYMSPRIRVSNWYRTITDTSRTETTIKNIRLQNATIETTQKRRTEFIGRSPYVAAIRFRNKTLLAKSKFRNLREAYKIIQEIENKLQYAGLRIKYETEKDALKSLRKGNADAVICTPKLTKQKIVKAAMSDFVLAPKTTRHIIPARPMRLNVPLSLLKNKKSLAEINALMRNMLQSKRLRTLPLGSVLDGRRYEEQLHIFEG